MNLNVIPDSVRAYLPGEFQATNPAIPLNTDFLTNNKFIFILNRCPTLTYFCQRANIPSVTNGISIQNNPNAVQLQRPGTSINLEELQISFAVDAKLLNWIEIFEWMKDMMVYGTYLEVLKENQKVSSATLLMLNTSYRPMLRVNFFDVFPTFLSGLDFDSTLPDTDNIIASVNFTYSYFDVERLDT